MNDLGKLTKLMTAALLSGAALLWSVSAHAAEEKKPKPSAAQVAKPAATSAAEPRVVAITVTEKGFEPSPIKVKQGEPLKLVVTRKTEHTCATELLVQDTKINVPLPLNKTVEIPYTPTKTGQVKYGCAMGMMIAGVLLVE